VSNCCSTRFRGGGGGEPNIGAAPVVSQFREGKGKKKKITLDHHRLPEVPIDQGKEGGENQTHLPLDANGSGRKGKKKERKKRQADTDLSTFRAVRIAKKRRGEKKTSKVTIDHGVGTREDGTTRNHPPSPSCRTGERGKGGGNERSKPPASFTTRGKKLGKERRGRTQNRNTKGDLRSMLKGGKGKEGGRVKGRFFLPNRPRPARKREGEGKKERGYTASPIRVGYPPAPPMGEGKGDQKKATSTARGRPRVTRSVAKGKGGRKSRAPPRPSPFGGESSVFPPIQSWKKKKREAETSDHHVNCDHPRGGGKGEKGSFAELLDACLLIWKRGRKRKKKNAGGSITAPSPKKKKKKKKKKKPKKPPPRQRLPSDEKEKREKKKRGKKEGEGKFGTVSRDQSSPNNKGKEKGLGEKEEAGGPI